MQGNFRKFMGRDRKVLEGKCVEGKFREGNSGRESVVREIAGKGSSWRGCAI